MVSLKEVTNSRGQTTHLDSSHGNAPARTVQQRTTAHGKQQHGCVTDSACPNPHSKLTLLHLCAWRLGQWWYYLGEGGRAFVGTNMTAFRANTVDAQQAEDGVIAAPVTQSEYSRTSLDYLKLDTLS